MEYKVEELSPVKRKVAVTANVRDRLKVVEDVLEEAIGRTRVEAEVGQRVKVERGCYEVGHEITIRGSGP